MRWYSPSTHLLATPSSRNTTASSSGANTLTSSACSTSASTTSSSPASSTTTTTLSIQRYDIIWSERTVQTWACLKSLISHQEPCPLCLPFLQSKWILHRYSAVLWSGCTSTVQLANPIDQQTARAAYIFHFFNFASNACAIFFGLS